MANAIEEISSILFCFTAFSEASVASALVVAAESFLSLRGVAS